MWEYSKLLFKKKDIWNQLSPRDIIEEDMRNVEFNGNWVSISQVETMNNRELKKKEIEDEIKTLNKSYNIAKSVFLKEELNTCFMN